jgi:glutamate/tyrosine decarboxylase-like PLP-dependent enzyme
MSEPSAPTPQVDEQSWQWSAEEIKRVGYRVIDLIAHHLTTLPDRRVFQPFDPELARQYLASAAPPEAGVPADAILDTFAAQIEPYPFGNGHPRFHGWVNSPPAVMGIFADALAAAMNPSCAGGNHAAIYVERQVIGWFKRMLGFPDAAMGLLVSGGSMAALTALAVARHQKCGFDVRAKGLQENARRLTFYKSAEGHGCNQKAIEMMGVGSDNIRLIEHDAGQRMIPAKLDAAIRADKQAGNQPIAVIASAGTVNSGAIDPLDAIADICQERSVWLHVDGAYGAPAILSTKYREQLRSLARADSLALDPHKWLYVPVEAGLVLVRDAQTTRSAFSLVPPYLRTDGSPQGVGGLPWFSEYGFQQTRGFRALKVWMALKHHGTDGYRRAIDHDIELALQLAEAVRGQSDFELFEPQGLSIVCFRFVPRDGSGDEAALNALNKALLERMQLEGKSFVSSTVMEGKFWLRACMVNPRTTEADVLALVQCSREAGRACLKNDSQ